MAVIGYFARDLKLYVKNVKGDKKSIYLKGIFSVVMTVAIVFFSILIIKDRIALIYDITVPVIFAFIMYYTTYKNKEKYELTKKINAIPEVKKANNVMKIFTFCYLGIPLISSTIYMFIIRRVSFPISDVVAIIILFYLIIFFIISIFFSRPFIKHYIKEMKNR